MKKAFFTFAAVIALLMTKAQVQVPVLTQDFEGGSIPAGWTALDGDNDGYNWKHSSTMAMLNGHNSAGCVYSESYDDDTWASISPDNWLFLPAVTLTGSSSLTYWVLTLDSDYPNEHYGVYVSTTSATDTGSFTMVFSETLTANDANWSQRTVNLDAYAGQTIHIAFRHYNCSYQYLLAIDDISVLTTSSSSMLTVSPASLDFGSVAVGSSSITRQVTVGAFNATGMVSASVSGPFEVSADNTAFGAAASLPDTGGVLYVRYLPATTGADSATLTVMSGAQTETVALTGNGISCASITLPFAEGFEDSELNPCWMAFAANANNPNASLMGVTDEVVHTGNQSFGFSAMYASSDPHQYLITPELPVSGIKMVSFNYLAYYGIIYPETFRVGYSTTTPDPSAFIWGNDIVSTSGNWENYLDVAVPGNVKYVAIDYHTAQGAFFFVDNFSVQAAPSCMAPTNLTVSNITTTSATLGWTQTSENMDITLYYVTNADSNVQVIPSVFLADGAYLFENLSDNTTYSWMLGVICDGDTLFSDLNTFTTPCAPVSQLPYTQDFNDETTYAIPSCWQRLCSTSTGYPAVTTSHARSGKALEFRFSYQTNTPSYMLLPQFTADLSDLQLTFWTRREGAESGTLTVGFMTSTTDTGTFVPVADVSSEQLGDNSYHFVTVTFPDVVPVPNTDYYIAMRYSSQHNYYWYVDDLAVDEIPDCMNPYGLVVGEVTAHTANVSWSGTADSYNVYYKTSSDTAWTVLQNVALDSTGYTITGLAATTAYQWKVAAVCNDGTLAESITSSTFTTGCGVYPAPYEQTFAANALPLCWERMTGPVSAPQSTNAGWGFANTQVFGQYHATLNFPATASHYWLVTPEIDLTGLTDPALIFEAALTGHDNASAVDSLATAGDRFLVLVSTDNGVSWSADNAVVWSDDTSGDHSFSQISATGEMVILPLTDYYGETIRIAFYGESAAGGGNADLHLDNVRVEETPACPNPSQLVITDVTNTSANLSWTENGTASSWKVEYGPENSLPGEAAMVLTDTTSVSLTNLQQNTTYEVRVSALCSDGTYTSAVVGVFTTKLTPAALPYSTDFSASSDQIWLLNNGECVNQWTMGTVDGSPALYITNHNATQPAAYTVTSTSVVSAVKSLIVGTANNIRVSFDVTIGGESFFDFMKLFLAPDTMAYPASTTYSSVPYASASYSVNAFDFSDYLPYSTYHSYPYKFNLTDSNSVHIDAVMPNPNLNPTAASTAQLVFLWRNDYSTGTQPGAIISNLSVKESTCQAPVDLTANNVTDHAATLDWTAGAGETAWNVEYREASSATWTAVPVSVNSYPMTGLTPTTTYYARVQANCGNGDLSPFVTTVFTTDSSAVTPPVDPSVATNGATDIGTASATLHATITNPDDVVITAKGFEWKATAGDTYTAVTGTGSGNDFIAALTGLSPNTDYTFKAFITFNDTTVYGSEAAFTTLPDDTPEPCDAPTGLTVSAVTDESITIVWDAHSGVSNWNIRYSTVGGTLNSAISNTNSYTLSGLTPETTYSIQVQADCGDGNLSEWSNAVTGTTTTGIDSWLANSVTLFPNPAKEVVNVQCIMYN